MREMHQNNGSLERCTTSLPGKYAKETIPGRAYRLRGAFLQLLRERVAHRPYP